MTTGSFDSCRVATFGIYLCRAVLGGVLLPNAASTEVLGAFFFCLVRMTSAIRPQKLGLTFMLLECDTSFGRRRNGTWSVPRNKRLPAAGVANPPSKEWRLTPYQEFLSFWHWLNLRHSNGGRDAARYAAGRCSVHTSLREQRRRWGNALRASDSR
jgi:hypothetical protein